MSPSRTLDTLDEAGLRSLLSELGREAAEFRFRIAPNPCVGAAILSGTREVARGFHQVWAGAHAEVQAMAAARSRGVAAERWDTIVCTLEPCSTDGKTGPCTRALIDAGLRRVVVGALDPDPRHRGKGLELLQEAGLETVLLASGSPLEEVSPHFLDWTAKERVRRPRPWLIAKWAQTRTGQLTPPKDVGDGRWISGPESLAEVHERRGRVDAILTGVGTVLKDDPRLTVRPPGNRTSPPLRVVLDTELRTRPESTLLRPPTSEEEAGGDVWIFCRAGAAPARHRALEAAGAKVASLRPDSDGRVSLRAALEHLWDLGARRVLVEAGPTLQEALLDAGFVDQVAVYTGSVNGGRGRSLASRLSPERLLHPDHREVGGDAVLEAFYRNP
ncbi:MAG: bifunctional diaminohydroxyphosphoribosylaminopyrimidine deaminase/5-amino-6-(5-phosphoribosylamino)uracil reductase RibD [Planctomycetota bacterium]